MNLYRCDNCEFQLEATKCAKKCKHCKGGTMLERTHYKDPDTGKMILYKYTEGPYIAVRLGDSELKTVDHLGRRNFERDSKNGTIIEKQAKEDEQANKAWNNNEKYAKKQIAPKKKEKKRPWWRTTDKPDQSLAKLSKEQQERYILTGEK